MKLKSLVLGSVAAAGLSTGAFAADLNVLTSLDVCDMLGMSGLTISSDSNCLQISGGVTYQFDWGDYNDFVLSTSNLAGGTDFTTIGDSSGEYGDQDWKSDLDWWLQFVGASDSDFGTAKAVIRFEDSDDEATAVNEVVTNQYDETPALTQAYVSVGDGTVLVAGLRGDSTYDEGDDSGLTWIKTWLDDDAADDGVYSYMDDYDYFSDASIQLYHDLGNGFTIKGGLENLDQDGTTPADAAKAGTAIGTIEYSGDGISGHASLAGGGILDGQISVWEGHAGVSASIEDFKLVAAIAGGKDSFNDFSYWNGLLSGSATFDMFTLAATVDGDQTTTAGATNSELGFAGSAVAAVTEDVDIKLGGRWFDTDTSVDNDEIYQIAIGVVASLNETLTASAELGYYGSGSSATLDNPDASITYGKAELAWAPGGGFTSSIAQQINSEGGYKTTFKAAKSFQ